MFAYAGLIALAAAAITRAEPVPTAPGPGDSFKEGSQCSFTWTPDTTGVWKEMNVQLMSGSNLAMVHITTVATLDGTDASKTSFTYDCPEVTPNSAIYFYQFSTPSAPTNLTWTTRFTIAAADGTTTPPANQNEPDGQAIPWGTGALVDPSKAVAAPPYLTSGSTGTGTAAAGSSTSVTTAVSSTAAQSATSAAAASTTAASVATSTKFVSAPAAPATSSASTSNSSASAANGAASLLGSDNYAVRAGIALGLAAFTFAFAL